MSKFTVVDAVYWHKKPPSTGSGTPVTQRASSLARKTATRATSSVSPIPPNTWASSIFWRVTGSFCMFWVMVVLRTVIKVRSSHLGRQLNIVKETLGCEGRKCGLTPWTQCITVNAIPAIVQRNLTRQHNGCSFGCGVRSCFKGHQPCVLMGARQQQTSNETYAWRSNQQTPGYSRC